jgi:hypothetical protein
MAMRKTLRARQPIMVLAALAFVATAGLLSACGPGSSGGPAAPQGSGSPVSQQSPVNQQSPASPAPTSTPLPGPGAEHLDPARFRTVTVVANLFSNGTMRKYSQVFDSPAVIARLTRMVNSFPAATKALTGCPPPTATYQLSFTVIGFEQDTTVTANACPVDQISVNGKTHTPLQDRSGALAAAIRGLLHLSSGS